MTARTLIHDVWLLDPEAERPSPESLLIEDGRVAARLPAGVAGPEGAQRIGWAGDALAPGFLDVHYHGALVFEAPSAAAASLRHAAAAGLRHGVTGFLATTVAWPASELMTRVMAWAEACDAAGSGVLGLHLEGPWISPRAAGAQPASGIREHDPAESAELLARAEGRIRMVTLAPEASGAASLLEALAARGVVASLGHSHATREEASQACAGGARHVTHLFNAMGPVHQREPGLAGFALGHDELSCDLICDGVHVHPDMIRVAARAKGAALLLITDQLAPPEGQAAPGSFGSGTVREAEGAWRLADGTLAGSTLTMDRALGVAEASGAMTRHEAVRAATLAPARLLGIEAERGTLRVGARADLVRLDPAGRVRECWVAGERAFARD